MREIAPGHHVACHLRDKLTLPVQAASVSE